MNALFDILTVRMDYDHKVLVIIDQTQLPGKEVYLELRTPEEIWEAIYLLKVRGAPAIGIAVAYGLALCAERIQGEDFGTFFRQFTMLKNYLAGSRPTAVNLFTALERLEKCVLAHRQEPLEKIKQELWREAEAIRKEDAAACRRIGEWGFSPIVMPDIWPCRNMGQLWLLFIWDRKRDITLLYMQMRLVLCCKEPV